MFLSKLKLMKSTKFNGALRTSCKKKQGEPSAQNPMTWSGKQEKRRAIEGEMQSPIQSLRLSVSHWTK
jgi:hypothetical protein